jgi:hypothetical protein
MRVSTAEQQNDRTKQMGGVNAAMIDGDIAVI